MDNCKGFIAFPNKQLDTRLLINVNLKLLDDAGPGIRWSSHLTLETISIRF